MNNNPQREREPELKEIVMAYESNLNTMDALIVELRNKVRSIHNPPQLEPASKNPSEGELKGNPDDAISELCSKNERLEMYNNRLEDILQALSRII